MEKNEKNRGVSRIENEVLFCRLDTVIKSNQNKETKLAWTLNKKRMNIDGHYGRNCEQKEISLKSFYFAAQDRLYIGFMTSEIVVYQSCLLDGAHAVKLI